MKTVTAQDCNVSTTDVGKWIRVYVRVKDFSFLSATRYGAPGSNREVVIAALTLDGLRHINQLVRKLETWLHESD